MTALAPAPDWKSFRRDGVELSYADTGGAGPVVVILHGLAGSAREFLPTAEALRPGFRVLLPDARGHGRSTRIPADVSRDAHVADVVALIERESPDERVHVIGQSMGGHTAMLVAARHPALVEQLILLEVVPSDGATGDSAVVGDYFASWPLPFASQEAAAEFLGDGPLQKAWRADLERFPDGLRPRFDARVMAATMEFTHRSWWEEWERIRIPVAAVFADDGMFQAAQKAEMIARRPATRRFDLANASHDAHLDAFERWIEVLRSCLPAEPQRLLRP